MPWLCIFPLILQGILGNLLQDSRFLFLLMTLVVFYQHNPYKVIIPILISYLAVNCDKD